MSRDEMLTALAARGLDHDIIEGMDDLQLAECMKMATEEAPNPTDVPTAATDSPTTFDESMMPEDKEKASEFCRKMAELYKKKFGEDLMTVPAKPLPEEKPVEKAEEKKEDPLADRQFSEMARAQAKLFCETYRDRIDPAELDETAGPTLLDRLMAADDSRKIFKFSENGKQVALTQREEMMRSVRLRKIRYGGDKVKGGSAGVVTFAEGATKKDKIKAFAESKSDKLALMGMTAAEYANAWEIAQGSDKAELENGIGFTG